jgi:hypothetical protein
LSKEFARVLVPGQIVMSLCGLGLTQVRLF